MAFLTSWAVFRREEWIVQALVSVAPVRVISTQTYSVCFHPGYTQLVYQSFSDLRARTCRCSDCPSELLNIFLRFSLEEMFNERSVLSRNIINSASFADILYM